MIRPPTCPGNRNRYRKHAGVMSARRESQARVGGMFMFVGVELPKFGQFVPPGSGPVEPQLHRWSVLGVIELSI